MKRLAIIACMLMVFAVVSVGNSAEMKTRNTYNDKVDIALKEASKDNGTTIIVFCTEWCSPCREFKKKTLEPMRKAIKEAKYRLLVIDVDKAKEHRFIKRLKSAGIIKFLPCYVMATNGGEKLMSHGFGNKSPNKFAEWIRKSVENWKKRKNGPNKP